MRMQRYFYLLLAVLSYLCLAFTNPVDPPSKSEEVAIQWYTLEEAQKANSDTAKNILINLYSNKCKWHVAKDTNIFKSREVVEYINKHFYPVKFDVEADKIEWRGKTYLKTIRNGRKVNSLAVGLLNGDTTYPSLVLLKSDYQRVGTIKGYMNPEKVLQALEFTAEAKYRDMSLSEYCDVMEFNKD